MATDLFMVKRLGSLVPADDQGKTDLDRYTPGVTVRVSITDPSPRSIRQHRLFFGLLRLVSEASDYSQDELLTLVKIGVGHVDWVTFEGKEIPMPRSISFAAMKGTDFRKFFDDAVSFLCMRVLPAGTNPKDLEREVFDLLGLPTWSAA